MVTIHYHYRSLLVSIRTTNLLFWVEERYNIFAASHPSIIFYFAAVLSLSLSLSLSPSDRPLY